MHLAAAPAGVAVALATSGASRGGITLRIGVAAPPLAKPVVPGAPAPLAAVAALLEAVALGTAVVLAVPALALLEGAGVLLRHGRDAVDAQRVLLTLADL